ncbi:MAG: hypothetical protein B6D54_04545 [Epsilonproteobacteria bacterium 4484_65]|nr:MAG: hypothetical protein B6D54_04545 [Epsilonproteobacteria bacterium 4484_65]
MVEKVHVLLLDVAMYDVSLLYIEDDTKAQEHYAKGFSTLFHKVYLASDSRSGFSLYQKEKPDILLVDIELPDESGLSLIKRIRQKDQETIIVILSAFSQQEKLLEAIGLGLYRYLIKPVRNTELLSVLKESIEIVQSHKSNPILLCQGLSWQSDACLLYENENEIPLSKRENALISLLYSNRNKIFSLEDIAYFVWEEREPSQQAIKNLINRLRKKVSVDFIRNHYAVGYQLCG